MFRLLLALVSVLTVSACDNTASDTITQPIDVQYCFTDRGALDYDADAVLKACDELLKQGDELSAEDTFEGFYSRGLTKRELNDLEGSERDLRKALELEPERDDVVRMLAWTLREKGDLVGALSLYNRAIEMMPDDWQGFLSRCVVLGAGLKRYAEAAADCQNAISLGGINDDTVFFASNALNQIGSYKDAVELIEAHSDKDFTSARVYEEYIVALIGLNEIVKAGHALNAATDEFPADDRFRRLADELTEQATIQ